MDNGTLNNITRKYFMENTYKSPKRWDARRELESLSRFNHLGLDFYNQTGYRERIAEVVGMDVALLYTREESVYALQDALLEYRLESSFPGNLGDLDKIKIKEIINEIESELLLYLITFDEYKKSKYKIKARRGFVEIDGRYCPVLIKRSGDIDLGLVRYLAGRLLEEEYYFGILYGNARYSWKVEWDQHYVMYDDLKIITLE